MSVGAVILIVTLALISAWAMEVAEYYTRKNRKWRKR